MSEIIAPYQTPQELETAIKYDSSIPAIILNPWSVQNVVYELVVNHLLANSPRSMGFPFDQVYNVDKTKSDFFVDIGFNWDAGTIQKRPAIFVTRTGAKYTVMTMRGQLGQGRMRESEENKTVMTTMGVNIKCIATNVGFTEQLAEYVKQGIMPHQWAIQRDFGFSKFRIIATEDPAILVESKEHFNVILKVETDFVEGWTVYGDHLKLKTISKLVYDGITGRFFAEQ